MEMMILFLLGISASFFLRHTKFGDWLVYGKKIFGLESVMEKCVGCFPVYLFEGGGGGGGY